ncbi:MAG: NAD(P)-dependent oxidoreductase, partial [Bauldia litoralis]
INCARGGLINEADLKEALDGGHVAGAALDVFEVEPAKENVLFGSEKLVATPHLGASTEEAQENVAVQVAEQISDFLCTGAITNPINMPAVSSDDAPKLRPYLALARQLGGFAGQITESPLQAVRISYQGHAASLSTKPLTAALLEGLLAPLLEGVNMVNAPILAKERGVDVTEETVEKSVDYQTRVKLEVTTDRRSRTVCGTLVGGDKPRIIDVEGIEMEAALVDDMLFVRNEDKPGFIGDLGRALGDAGINIATFHLGRSGPGGDAISLIAVDQPVEGDVLKGIRELPHVKQARSLRF